MQQLDTSFDDPFSNVALDEALLHITEKAADGLESSERTAENSSPEFLRIWESPLPMVVVGRSSRVDAEVNTDACRRRGIPVIRRSSGGAAVVAGPGCLMYAAVLSYRLRPQLRPIEQTHQFAIERLVEACGQLDVNAARQGTSDATIGDRKFSGNSVRCLRHSFLYHGTILYDFPLESIHQLLRVAPRQPDYRQGREHMQFVTNLPRAAGQIRQQLIAAWQRQADLVPTQLTQAMSQQTSELVDKKYRLDSWNLRL